MSGQDTRQGRSRGSKRKRDKLAADPFLYDLLHLPSDIGRSSKLGVLCRHQSTVTQSVCERSAHPLSTLRGNQSEARGTGPINERHTESLFG